MEWHAVREEVKVSEGDADAGSSAACQEGSREGPSSSSSAHMAPSSFSPTAFLRVRDFLNSLPSFFFFFLHGAPGYLFHFIDDEVLSVHFYYYYYVLIFCFYGKSDACQ